MGVDEEFERVRTALRAEEAQLARELDQIDAEARATVDASVEHVRTQLATQADRIREAIAQQRQEVEARQEELREDEAEWTGELEGEALAADGESADVDGATADGEVVVEDLDGADDGTLVDDEPVAVEDDVQPTTSVEQPDGTEVEQVTSGTDEPDDLIGDVERGD